ncbi:MAG: HAMP domain-containing histidine kinase [Proteiniphilum sp.]|nr:HAMP domain-containing histidine kinase [Proteiniphilum sp.]
MKLNSKYIFILKIISIVILSLVGAWLYVNNLYFSASIMLLIIIVVAVSIYYDRKRLFGRVEHLISSIQYEDFSTHFVINDKKDELSQLSKEMNEALEAFRNRSADAMMGETEAMAWQKLISVLTHEIMNSITPIISLSETLSEQAQIAEASEDNYKIMLQAMETIHRRSEGLLIFIENYRKLTRLPQPVVHPFALKTLFVSLQQLLASNNIVFTYSIYPEQLILNADKGMVEQVLINLLKNAHEACQNKENSKIDVKANKIGDEIHISVSDNGQGILPEVIEKVFIPFYSTKTNGSGIGLSICQQIMIRHKGKLMVQSDDRETKFTMVFNV